MRWQPMSTIMRANRQWILLLQQPRTHEIAHLLIRFDIPDAVACEHNELIRWSQVLHQNIRRRADDLLLRCQIIALLVLQISDSTAKIEISVDPGTSWCVLQVSSSSFDPCLFNFRSGLVVK